MGSLLLNIYVIGHMVLKSLDISGRLADGYEVTGKRQYGFYVIITLLVLRALTAAVRLLKKEEQQ